MTSGIATLDDLKVHFEQSVRAGELALTKDNGVAPRLVRFLGDLPAHRISLARPDIRRTADALTITGTTDARWLLGGTGDRALHVTGVTVAFGDAPDFAVTLRVTGALSIAGAEIAVVGELDPADRIDVRLADGPIPSVSLTALAAFVAEHKLDDYLPVGIAIFDTVPLSALRLSFGNGAVDLETTSTLTDATWQLVTGLAELHDIGVTLTNRAGVRNTRYEESIGGNIHASLRLGQDFRVRLALRGQHDWTLEILPADGNVLPGIAALARLVGGAALAEEIQAGFDRLGMDAFAVDGVHIGFDLATGTLGHMTVNGHLTVDGITFAVIVGLPDLTITGRLASNAIHLTALIGRYFPGAEHFPAIDVRSLLLAARPGAGEYLIAAGIGTDWTFDVGPVPVGFRDFRFTVERHPDGVTGGIEGRFTLFDADFEVVARHPAPGAGWRFTGRSLPGTRLTVQSIHERVTEWFGTATPLPAAVAGLALEELLVWFDTAGGDFEFTCAVSFPIDDRRVDGRVTIRLENSADGYRLTFGGHVTVDDLVFDLAFAHDHAATTLAAVYSHAGAARAVRVRDLVAAVSPAAAEIVPADLSIDLRDVLLVVASGSTPGFVLGLDLGVDIGLSALPLVGQRFPPDRRVGIDSLRLLVASRDFTAAEIEPVNAALPAGVPPLPAESADDTSAAPEDAPAAGATVVLTRGVTVTARLLLGGATARTLSLPAADPVATPGVVDGADVPVATGSDTTRWFDVQRAFGPLYFDRIGFEYRDRTVRFPLDAALSAGGLTLTLDGLSFGSPVDHFAPTFDLRGIGVDYRGGPVSIGGALLRTTVTDGERTYDEYDGTARIRTENLSLAALGSYAYVNDTPSLFVYAVLDTVLGGPPFLFVTGLAAGFGYNRTIVVPPIERVAEFPLITAARDPRPSAADADPRGLIRSTVDDMRAVLPPAAGATFLAVGIRFLSFRLVDSVALLVAGFGERFELTVLGLSTLVAPTPAAGSAVTPLAELQLAVKASFAPDEGFLAVRAQLTEASYLFSRDCHLGGGFAFHTWFAGEHDGDFALTVGGYHPAFRPPAHYPQVPRLALNWQIDPHLVVKGDAYYALTPLALMAGGHLEAVWQSGNLRAAFVVGADFIVAWQPYHYDARAYVDVNVSYTFELFGTHHVNVDLGADLHIWGPEFAGTAHITLAILSFDVIFGPQTPPAPTPLDWTRFSQAFLPDAADLCAIAVSDGLLRDGGAAGTELGVLDPQRLALRVATVIPSTGARIPGDLALDRLHYTGPADAPVFVPFTATGPDRTPTQSPTDTAKPVGAVAIGPMGIRLPAHDGPHLRSTLTIAITRGTEPMAHHFAFVPVLGNLPAGMWGELGESLRPDPNDAPLVRDALVGFEIRPAGVPLTGTDPVTAGDLELYRYHLPALPGGRYQVTVRQDVTTDEPAATTRIPARTFQATGDFVVAGVRPVIAPDEVYAVYPPADALGDYTSDLPHVILNHSTLPWQENADPGRDELPWLAVLLFDEPNVPASTVRTVGALRQGNPGVVFPADSLGEGQSDGEQVTVIDLPFGQLRDLLPAQDEHRRDLALSAHVRRAPDGTERAVLIGNRLPTPGADHVAHLVSVRGRYRATGFDPHGATDDTSVRLVSLMSWRFTCTNSAHDPIGLLRGVADRVGPLAPSGSKPGHLRVGHVDRAGHRHDAWYRGPLVPRPVADRPELPAARAEDLLSAGATPDVSYASAWQLGRLLALQGKPFAAALYRWKRARAKSRKQGATDFPPVPRAVVDWLNDTSLLRGVPFNNLVPAEAMLPVESLRFFSLHAGWLAALLDGALSIGRVTPADRTFDRTLAADIRTADGIAPWTRHVLGDPATRSCSGVLLRSDVVAGWPDLAVVAGADHPVRADLLSANTMLCLFAGEVTTVSIRLAGQVRHFGLGAAATEWQRDRRIVDLTALATARIGEQLASDGASGQLAARLLAPAPHVDVARPA